MYSLKVIAHSASGKSILASVTKKVGIFANKQVGNIAIAEGEEIPAIGTVIELEGIKKVLTRDSVTDEGQIFTWLVLVD